ncbi:hypothetical protein SAMD00019534_063330 [Acytostelium subglobosum LB1]|uniref:hypothetical protein n=1 Tax=Acytostelium subglobosum LB1 TaxID=1410327 RepID=UPI000644E846|nr:hypothetical protein SAMD00019534_063330 [Acytostelium subglobosum LB1]GAM23158.1 hypothetical protein SAMD00019534_063330 [Acytostelium subglobosum LB1]|eukprot:XP_012753607.1 hypothetical protein SAMD00019534_063330 [Acytostelium subglobosum LB1]
MNTNNNSSSSIIITLQELKNKLDDDRQQLQEIEALLEEDPSNEELHTLKAELVDLIKKSSDLIVGKERELSAATAAQATATSSSHANSNTPLYNAAAVSSPTSQTNHSDTLSSSSIAAAAAAAIGITGTSSSTKSSLSATTNTTTTATLSSPADSTVFKLMVGTKCEGKYSVDGVWYDAVIDEINKDGSYKVTYTEYGNSETLNVSDIRPVTRQKVAGTVQDQSSRYTTAADSLQQIPKHLKILPDDSEEVKKQKQKKIHLIKSQNRLYKADEESKKKKQAWQDFQNKPKKSIPGTFTDKKRVSMFSTPDNVNGRVGVIGSGRGMTESTNFSMSKKGCSIVQPTGK